MKVSTEIDLFKISRTLLQFMGETHNRPLRRIIIFRLFNITALLYAGVFIVANFFHVTGGSYVETMHGLMLVMHILLKYSLYIYFKPDMEELLQNKFETFWIYNHVDNRVLTNIIKIYRVTEFVQTAVIGAGLTVFYLYLFKPVITKNNPFPFEAWATGVMTIDIAGLACQYCFLCIAVPIVFSYDAIYFCLCIRTVAQVKLLKNRLRHFQEIVGFGASYYIKCHHLLLSTFTQLRRLYSSMLLFHYFVTLITQCTSIYAVLVERNSLGEIIANIITICAVFLQFAYFSFPAEMIAFELSDLSNAIYFSKWYLKKVAVQKDLLFMMAKAQHQLYFTGGGLIDINVRTFGSMIRTSFSFYTLLRNVLNK